MTTAVLRDKSPSTQSSTPAPESGLRLLTDDEIELIGVSMYWNVPRKDRTYRLRMYKNCFIGKQAVDYLVQALKLNSRDDAVFLGHQVLEKGIFYHVTQDHPFCDKYLFYVFNEQWESLAPQRQMPQMTQMTQMTQVSQMTQSSSAPRRTLSVIPPPNQLINIENEPSPRITSTSDDLLMDFGESSSPFEEESDSEFLGGFLANDTLNTSISTTISSPFSSIPQQISGQDLRTRGTTSLSGLTSTSSSSHLSSPSSSLHMLPSPSVQIYGLLPSPNTTISINDTAGLKYSSVKLDPATSTSTKKHTLTITDDQSQPSKKKRKVVKSNPITAEEKLQQRAEKSRNASRLYRQRKKIFIEELKQKLDDVNNEKSAIMQNFQKQEQLLQKLAEENSRLKHERVVDSNRLEGQRRDLIRQLEEMVSLGSSDLKIEPILKQIESLNLHIYKMSTNHLEELISPSTVNALLSSGFFKEHLPIAATQCGSFQDFAKKIFEFVHDLNNEQAQALNRVTEEHARELEQWKAQREKVNLDIEIQFLINTQKGKKGNPFAPLVFQDMLGITSTMESLRLNLENEAKSWDRAISRLLSVLSIRQRANFILQTEYRHASVQQLKYLWSAFYGSNFK